MRYSLFTATKATDTDVELSRFEVQAACDKAKVKGQPRIIICPFIAPTGEWAVPAPVEPKTLRGRVVDTVVVEAVVETIVEAIAEDIILP
jgi:hypothetical protein